MEIDNDDVVEVTAALDEKKQWGGLNYRTAQRRLLKATCRALGFEPSRVRGVTISVQMNEPVIVTVAHVVNGEGMAKLVSELERG